MWLNAVILGLSVALLSWLLAYPFKIIDERFPKVKFLLGPSRAAILIVVLIANVGFEMNSGMSVVIIVVAYNVGMVIRALSQGAITFSRNKA